MIGQFGVSKRCNIPETRYSTAASCRKKPFFNSPVRTLLVNLLLPPYRIGKKNGQPSLPLSDDVVRQDRAPACEVREKDGKFWPLFSAEEKLPHLTGYRAGAVLRG